MTGSKRLQALGWVGGKSAYSSTGTGGWIAGLLPPPGVRGGYIEPFAGMLGVLLQRNPASREIVSDLDGDLINWWRAVRDYPAQLGDLLDFTPGWSAALFAEAAAVINQPVDVNELGETECVRRAWCFTLVMTWVRGSMIGRVKDTPPGSIDQALRRRKVDKKGYSGVDRNTAGGFRFRHRTSGGTGLMSPPRSPQIVALSERVAEVELETRSAEWMTEYYGDNPDFVWYFDPPYQVAEAANLYAHNLVGIADWVPRLQAVAGLAAVSGYGTEWDGLGWRRHEHSTHGIAGAQRAGDRPERTEVLWTNYDPAEFEAKQVLF